MTGVLVSFAHPAPTDGGAGSTRANEVVPAQDCAIESLTVLTGTTGGTTTLKVAVWSSGGALLGSGSVTQTFAASTSYTVPLSSRVPLTSGATYLISAYFAATVPVARATAAPAPETHSGGSFSFTRNSGKFISGDAFPSSNAGAGVCTNVSPTVSTGISVTPVTVTEADSTPVVGRRKSKTTAVTTSTNTAQPITRRKAKALAVVTETDASVPITRRPNNIQVALTPVTETDTALAFGKIDPIQRPLVVVIDTPTAVPIVRTKRAGTTPVTEADSAPTLSRVRRLFRFTPPVAQELMHTSVRLFNFFTQPISFAVVRRNGHYVAVRVPSQEETDALMEGQSWFSGGRTYEVTPDTATLLQADGYEVSEWLVPVGA